MKKFEEFREEPQISSYSDEVLCLLVEQRSETRAPGLFKNDDWEKISEKLKGISGKPELFKGVDGEVFKERYFELAQKYQNCGVSLKEALSARRLIQLEKTRTYIQNITSKIINNQQKEGKKQEITLGQVQNLLHLINRTDKKCEVISSSSPIIKCKKCIKNIKLANGIGEKSKRIQIIRKNLKTISRNVNLEAKRIEKEKKITDKNEKEVLKKRIWEKVESFSDNQSSLTLENLVEEMKKKSIGKKRKRKRKIDSKKKKRRKLE